MLDAWVAGGAGDDCDAALVSGAAAISFSLRAGRELSALREPDATAARLFADEASAPPEAEAASFEKWLTLSPVGWMLVRSDGSAGAASVSEFAGWGTVD